MADLRWLGLDWDEGPDVGGPSGPYRQSERLERHRAAADELLASGQRVPLLLPRGAPRGAAPRGARRRPHAALRPAAASACRPTRCSAGWTPASRRPCASRCPAGEVVVDDLIRGRVVIGADALSDFIIVRSDGVAGYNFATVVDDRDMGITHVIRGDDHLTNTARQQLLFEALGAPVPRWAHHSMVLGPDGGKLSKRHGATAVGDYRELGYLPEAIVELPGAARLVARGGRGARARPPRRASSSSAGSRRARWCSTWPSSTGSTTSTSWRSRRRSTSAASRSGCRPGRRRRRRPRSRPPSSRRWSRTADAAAAAAEVLEPPPPPPELLAAARAAAPQLAHVRALRAEAPEWLAPAAARDLLAAYRAWGKEQGIGARDLLMPLRIALTVRRARAGAAVRARRARPRHRPRATRPRPRRERCR